MEMKNAFDGSISRPDLRKESLSLKHYQQKNAKQREKKDQINK